MKIIVTDTGFHSENAITGSARDFAADDNFDALQAQMQEYSMIRIHFASFADGRGFTFARRLREVGYTGRIRAYGHVIADQYAMARRSGFDEVEIEQDLAARQPEAQWQFRSRWQDHDYQSRLRGEEQSPQRSAE